jgi:hypothetical protein
VRVSRRWRGSRHEQLAGDRHDGRDRIPASDVRILTSTRRRVSLPDRGQVGPRSNSRVGVRELEWQQAEGGQGIENVFYIIGAAIVAVAVFGLLGFD